LWQFWEEEHDRHSLRCLLGMMEIEFKSASMPAFRAVALEGAPASTRPEHWSFRSVRFKPSVCGSIYPSVPVPDSQTQRRPT
jgi:hypothetical protein